MGPSHPATHGTVRMKVELEGETIVQADPEIGFLHRGFQKSCENVTWTQCLPYTDRLNYVSAMMNNFGFLNAVEKLIGLEIPERAQYIRVIGSELHRMHDHLTCVGAIGLELGGFSAFLYAIEARELIMDRVSRADRRAAHHQLRPRGRPQPRPARGLDREGPSSRWTRSKELARRGGRAAHAQPHLRGPHAGAPASSPPRTRSTSASPAPACAPAASTTTSARRSPYWVYDQLDFDVPVGENGDNYDRYLMRLEELKQSDRIIRQALEKIPAGPIIVDDWRIALPPKPEVYGTIEGVMSHFKLVMEGIPVPAGRGLRLHRGGQRRAGLVPGERRLAAGRTRSTCARRASPSCPGVPHMIEGQDAGGPDPHVRHDQHDRRRGRAVSENDGKKPTGDAQPPPKGAPTTHPAAKTGPSPSNPPPAPKLERPRAGTSTSPPRPSRPRRHPGRCASRAEEPGLRHLHRRRQGSGRQAGDEHDRGRQVGRLGHPLLLLPPAALHRGQLPHVPRRGVQRAQAGAGLPDADGRGRWSSRPRRPR